MSTPEPGVIARVAQYYTAKLEECGPTHEGVDWNSAESQELRFAQVLRITDGLDAFSLNDVGCGYGALAHYLAADDRCADYRGFDVSESMVVQARELAPARLHTSFTSRSEELAPADVTVASGIFSVKLDVPVADWEDHIRREVDRLATLGTHGFAFNMLTGFAEPDRMRPDLYYADPGHWLRYCWSHHSRHVAILHDYGLWEFTLLVRAEPTARA